MSGFCGRCMGLEWRGPQHVGGSSGAGYKAGAGGTAVLRRAVKNVVRARDTAPWHRQQIAATP